MKSPTTYLVVLLALTAGGGGVLAWRQYLELVELRAAAMNTDERADLQKRLWDLEKHNRELQDRLAARREPTDMAGSLGAGDEEGRGPRDRGGRGGRGGSRPPGFDGPPQIAAIRDLMSKPEVQAMIGLQQKAAVEARYATLFRNLNLTPDQAGKLTTLLVERSTTMQDVMGAAHDQGINPRENPDAFRKLVTDAQNEVNASIKSVIGDQGFAQLTTYEQTLPQRNLVNELQQRLSYTSAPLTATQAEQMVEILAANTPQRPATSPSNGPTGPGVSGPPPGRGPDGFGGRGGDFGGMIAGALGGGPGGGMVAGMFDGGRGGGGATITNAAVTQSQTVLSPSQVSALQQLQQQQQAQQQLRQMVSDTLIANQPGRPPDGAANAPAGSSGPSPATKRGRGGE